MDRQSKVNLEALLVEIARMDFKRDDSGTLMARWQWQSISMAELAKYPELNRAIMEISRLTKFRPLNWMINDLPAGVEVPKHTDTLEINNKAGKLVVSRWHLPVKTNALARYWDEGLVTDIHFPAGIWAGPIPYWKPHSIWNHGDENRVNLVVDLEGGN